MSDEEDLVDSGSSDEEEVHEIMELFDVKTISSRRGLGLVCPSQEQRLPHGKLVYDNILKLEDINGEKFLAQENTYMIRWAGRDEFIDT